MMGNPTVSIVMPLYNAEEYIAEAVESVLAQSFEDWELIIVDDCSTDSSRALAEGFARNDLRISVYVNERNSGAAATRTAGLRYVTGRYLAFLDADDAWLPGKLTAQLAFMEGGSCPMSFTSYETVESDGSFRNIVRVPSRLDYEAFLKNTVTCSHTVMFDLSTVPISLLRAPDYDFDFSEDLAVWLQVVKTGVEARGLDAVLAKNRKHAVSRSANKLRAVRRTWTTYRKVENLSIAHSAYCLAFQLFYAVRKRMRSAGERP